MAQQVSVSFVDDMDGSEAEGTVSFGLEGKSYEIDLSEANAAKLRDVFAQYVGAGRRVGGTARAGRAATGKASSSTAEDRERNQAIREWAQTQGMKVSNRGRLPAEVVEAYNNKDVKPAIVEPPVTEPEVEAPAKKRRSRSKAKVES